MSELFYIQRPKVVEDAHKRTKKILRLTPVLLREEWNHNIYFKVDALQHTGAFKVRGVLNHLLSLREKGRLPPRVATYSTGNHGIGLAWVARHLGIAARIYLPKYTAKLKQQITESYGVEVCYTNSRIEAEDSARNTEGFYFLHPSDSDSTIAGAGTLCYEAIQQMNCVPDAIFAACGGGGLLSGSYLAKELLASSSLLFGSEPLIANDAFLSLQCGKIFKFTKTPNTVADGLRTLFLSDRTFHYLQKIDKLFLVNEDRIKYWTVWLKEHLKISCEPSCAINMESVYQWLKLQIEKRNVLVLISGGNVDRD